VLLIGTVFAETGKVNVSATRLREEKDVNSNILTNIYENDTVEILEESGDWYKVKYDGKTGYVKKEYITLDKKKENTNTVNPNTVSGNTTNIGDEVESNNSEDSNSTNNLIVNLRTIPSMTSRVFTQIELSKSLTKVNEIGNWLQVTDGNITGWILKAKMKVLENSSPVQPPDFTNTMVENKTNTSVENVTNTISNTNSNQVNTSNSTTNVTQTNNTSEEESTNKTGIVNVETAKVTDFLDYNDKVTIVAEDGDWYKITSPKSGYVNKKLITISKDTLTSRSLTEERKKLEDNSTVSQEVNDTLSEAFGNCSNGTEIVEYAKQYIGCSYVVGGKTPEAGFDCSGFTKYVYSNFGYSLGSTAASQINLGVEISRDELELGDLILFYNEGKTAIGHTGIYIGNGEFVHAANPTRGVVTDNINSNSYYNERFVSARRIIE